MDLLSPNIQHYHWGTTHSSLNSKDDQKGDQPGAELWMGAHPTSPSRTVESDRGLDDIIATGHKYARTQAGDFQMLPFIMKICDSRTLIYPSSSERTTG